MNILVESGATKSTCIGYNDGCTLFMHKTSGINATYAKKEEIYDIFQEIIAKNNIAVAEVKNIRFYGAGCFITQNAEKVKGVLTSLFPNAKVAVYSDLYAACHALCKNNSGYVGILGTGSASCFYNGEQISAQAPSLGWLLGDEGSGSYIGKQFVIKYLSDKLESEIVEDFEQTFSVSKSIIYEKVYQKSNPRIFFASIPVFLQKYVQKQQIKAIIENSFQDFFDKQKDYYSTYPHPWYFCGSIAYYFQDILIETSRKNNITIEKIIQESAENLIM
jgi:N-acetylglucosamine kinase-like BadF-type ATPase